MPHIIEKKLFILNKINIKQVMLFF